MSGGTKVIFTVGLGINGCHEEHEFTLDELGYDPKFDKDLDKFLEREYVEWRNDRLDGNWRLEGDCIHCNGKGYNGLEYCSQCNQLEVNRNE